VRHLNPVSVNNKYGAVRYQLLNVFNVYEYIELTCLNFYLHAPVISLHFCENNMVDV
jgi:hypothetical protein